MSRAHLAGGESFHVSRKATYALSLSRERTKSDHPARKFAPSISCGALLGLHNVITYKKIIIHGEPCHMPCLN
jgi:hypothetical protein